MSENNAAPQLNAADPWRRKVLENALDAVVGMDANQIILDWNLQAEITFGWSRSEALGRPLAEVIIPHAYRAAHAAGMKHYLSTGEGPVLNRRIEVEGLRRDGTIFPIELTVIPIEIKGRPVFYSFLRDISEPKHLELVLLQNEEKFRTIAESIPQYTWMGGPDGVPTWNNQRWYDFTGLNLEQLNSEDGWATINHPDHIQRVSNGYRLAIREGKPWEDVFPLRGKSGEWRWFLSRVVPVRFADGKISSWFGTNTDVTDQRRNRESLAFLAEASTILSSSLDYNETLQKVAQVSVPTLGDWCSISVVEKSVPQSIAVAHPDPEMMKIAEEFRTKFPTDWGANTGAALVLKTGVSQLHPLVSDEMIAASAQNAEHLRLLRALKIRSVMIIPIRGRAEVLGILTLVSSSEERRYSDADLKIAEELSRRAGLAIDNARLFTQAQEAIRMRDEFLSIASHELKTPLTSLKLQAQLASRQSQKSGVLDEKTTAKFLDTTINQINRLSKLVDDMLDISRITHGKLSVQPEEVNLGELVRDVVDRFQEQFSNAGSSYQLHISDHVLGKWDRYRIEQVVTNLLTNAIKYGSGKPIDISVLIENQQALIRVKDQGMGIATENYERIFERFERAILSTNISGLGLGLYISRQIVEAHGGKITVESEPAKGSVFTVSLPLNAVQS